jgi:hypothetical protein
MYRSTAAEPPDVAITITRTRGGPCRQRSGGAIHFPCRPQQPPAIARVSEARPTTEPLPPRPPVARLVYAARESIISVSEEIKQQLRRGELSIHGRAEDAERGRTIHMVSPATGDSLTTVPDGAAGGADRAVAASRSGQSRISSPWLMPTPNRQADAGCR